MSRIHEHTTIHIGHHLSKASLLGSGSDWSGESSEPKIPLATICFLFHWSPSSCWWILNIATMFSYHCRHADRHGEKGEVRCGNERTKWKTKCKQSAKILSYLLFKVWVQTFCLKSWKLARPRKWALQWHLKIPKQARSSQVNNL